MRLLGKLKPSKQSVYQGRRMQILQGSREKLGISVAAGPRQPWGVLMDWRLESASATVVALSDGNASVYLSSGGGSLGGWKSHENFRDGATNAAGIASRFQPTMLSATSYPLPDRNEVTSCVLTDAGVFTGTASARELSRHSHALWPLGAAMQEIITQYRQIQQ